MVIAAEQYASRLVVPQSQRRSCIRWSSQKDHAAKALKKLAGPHLPASLKELERAIARAHREHDTAVKHAHEQARQERAAAAAASADDCEDLVDVDHEADVDGDHDDVDEVCGDLDVAAELEDADQVDPPA